MVKHVLNPQEIQWLSSDGPPIASDGTKGHVVDTGEMLVWHDGDWYPDRRLQFALKQAFEQ